MACVVPHTPQRIACSPRRLTGQTVFQTASSIISVEPMGAETLLWSQLGDDPLSIRVDSLQGFDEARN